MAINFPSNPSVNQNFTVGSNTWIWSGVAWNIKPPGSNLDDLTDVNLTGVQDGQVLYYNATTQTWGPLSLTSSFNGGSISNPLQIQNSTSSSGIGSGALVVTGGVGIGGGLNVGGAGNFSGSLSGTNLTLSSGGASITGNSQVTGSLTVTTTGSYGSTLTVRSASELRFNDTANDNYIGFKAPANLTQNTTYQWPSTDGTVGYVLSTNGSGALSWVPMTGGGGGGGGSTNPPGGVNGDIQFNSNGVFGGSTNFKYDVLTDIVTFFSADFTGTLDAQNNGDIVNLGSLNFTGSAAQITSISIDTSLTGNSNTAVPTEAAVKTYVDDGLSFKAPIANPTFTGTVSGVTKSMVGLGNVTNESKATMFTSPTFTGTATAADLTVSGHITSSTTPTNINHVPNKKYVDTRAIAMGIALS